MVLRVFRASGFQFVVSQRRSAFYVSASSFPSGVPVGSWRVSSFVRALHLVTFLRSPSSVRLLKQILTLNKSEV